MSGQVRIQYARCWGCMLGQHYDPPEPHPWADDEDIEHAQATGQPKPEGNCACECAGGPGACVVLSADDPVAEAIREAVTNAAALSGRATHTGEDSGE